MQTDHSPKEPWAGGTSAVALRNMRDDAAGGGPGPPGLPAPAGRPSAPAGRGRRSRCRRSGGQVAVAGDPGEHPVDDRRALRVADEQHRPVGAASGPVATSARESRARRRPTGARHVPQPVPASRRPIGARGRAARASLRRRRGAGWAAGPRDGDEPAVALRPGRDHPRRRSRRCARTWHGRRGCAVAVRPTSKASAQRADAGSATGRGPLRVGAWPRGPRADRSVTTRARRHGRGEESSVP